MGGSGQGGWPPPGGGGQGGWPPPGGGGQGDAGGGGGGGGGGGWPPPASPPPAQGGGAWPPPQGPVPQAAPPPPGGGYAPPPTQAGASGKAIAALILAICSWVLCCGWLTSAPAVFLAKSELNAIERGESSPAGKGLAQAAFWIALINLILSCLGTIGYGVMFAIAAASGQSPYYGW